jgi:FMN phosphatase YigB (HAD superfamily)
VLWSLYYIKIKTERLITIGGNNMDSKVDIFKIIRNIFEKVRVWIIFIDIVFLFIVSLLGDIFGNWRERLLLAGGLVVLSLLFQVLISIVNTYKKENETVVFSSIVDALDKIKEVVKDYKQVLEVKIIAATGGNTLGSIIPAIIQTSPARKIEITMGVLSPKSNNLDWIPSHWPAESTIIIERLKSDFIGSKTSVDLFLFDNLPVIHGLLINDEHLFLGFYEWTQQAGQYVLEGSQLPHTYYKANDTKDKHYFELFKSWFEHCPRTIKKENIYIFDFDGTLMDSYACLTDVYSSVGRQIGLQENMNEKFTKMMISTECIQDSFRIYDREKWWPKVFREFDINISEERLRELVKTYWRLRRAGSKIIAPSEKILKAAKNKGYLVMLCRSDGYYGNKMERIEKSGLSYLFDEINIVGENVANMNTALSILLEKYKVAPNKVTIFDDQPFYLNDISRNNRGVNTVKIDFETLPTITWSEECTPTHRIRNIGEAQKIFDGIFYGDK